MTDPDKTTDPLGASPANESEPPILPLQIGRYRVEKVLGEGGFGLVYLARDDQLQRLVAIKVPHPELIFQASHAKVYLTEARTVANLDHPHIVPVFDVGSTEHFPFFVVSKYIDGTDLQKRLKQSRLSTREAVELVATVAEALHYAHKQGLVHRDIKPSNLLLERTGKPFLADFGLALRERDVGKGPRYAGSPAYMSPEQARGEGHRVDGRSDIFSLGVVFYELLTGRKPFKADSQDELLEQVTSLDPRPPRQHDDNITKELERICLKAMSKRAAERYMTALDMADDLRQFLAEQPVSQQSGSNATVSSPSVSMVPQFPPSMAGSGTFPTVGGSGTFVTPGSDSQLIKIVPKGLRSFDAHDADFFLELLPGPRDRNGLPDSIRFWKSRIEELDADNTFSVGMIYGPSGCGKSSLVKAGLLPRLSPDVAAIYVEATAQETETRLLNALRKRFPALPTTEMGLKDTLTTLRREPIIPPGKKLVIVLDQFEQWLHAKQDEPNTELVQALRQCDGGRVQCIVMVRDDFWMAVTRFLTSLEIELLQGRNCAAADLFDLDHAGKVLAALGRAFGKLPDSRGHTSRDQKEFLRQVVAGLSQDGKVICVRLALFAEMMKGKPWTPTALKEVGGTEGVGITFLEETFSSQSANPAHRMHQKAAQAVLKSLLPDGGTDIKGHMRSDAELREASGYADQPALFDALLRILDSEIRLITPTDPEGKSGAVAESSSPVQARQKYYQLTHDYLVPSLREWLTRKQKETKAGRTELLLAEQATQWNVRPENRQLPSLWQWFNIRLRTNRRNWTPSQRRLIRQADRYYASRCAVAAVLLLLIGWGSYEAQGMMQSHALRDRLLDANTGEVPTIVREMAAYRRWLGPLLHVDPHKTSTTPANQPPTKEEARRQLHASLALLPVDTKQLDYLFGRMLTGLPSEVAVIRDSLAPHKESLVGKLWAIVEDPAKGNGAQRIRAASALAKYAPQDPRWATSSTLIVDDLVLENSIFLGRWSEAFRPVKNQLLPPLSAIYRDPNADRAAERLLATNLLADYASDQTHVLAELIMDADDKQFVVMYPRFLEQGERGITELLRQLDLKSPPDAPRDAQELLAKRQANAAAILLKMNLPEKVWPLWKHSPDPTVRSFLIHRIRPRGIDAKVLADRLEVESDVTARSALILSLGEYPSEELSPQLSGSLIKKLQDIYQTDLNPGLHASTEWTLRQWKQGAWLKQVNEAWVADQPQQRKRAEGIVQTASPQNGSPLWQVNGQGQTQVIVPGPVEFLMGSPLAERDRQEGERQHKVRIPRSFLVSTKSVTMEQYKRYKAVEVDLPKYVRTADLPVIRMSWFDAAAYCNWLSKQEGIPEDQWCFVTDADGKVTQLKSNYLTLTGYRLPTEPEIEYVSRAGATSSRYFGDTAELLPKYAWYQKTAQDQTWPVGSLKPNDFGLFDMHGNVFTWCQESAKPYATDTDKMIVDDKEDLVLTDTQFRVLRGSSFFNQPSITRCAYRYFIVPTIKINYSGFRVARTVAPAR